MSENSNIRSALTSKDFSLEIGFSQSFTDFFKEFNFLGIFPDFEQGLKSSNIVIKTSIL